MHEMLPLSRWQAAVEGGVRELARDGLGLGEIEVLTRDTRIPEQMPGAFIPLIAPAESIQVGFVSSPEGCKRLALALMQGTVDSMSQADLADALGEAANILAGFVKREVQDDVSPVQLGLPLYVNGHLETSERVSAAVTHFRVGDVEAAIIVLRAAEFGALLARPLPRA